MDPLSIRSYLRKAIVKRGVSAEKVADIENTVVVSLRKKGIPIDWYAYQSQYRKCVIGAIDDAILEDTTQKS